jgi:transcription antitermination factor NusG
MRTLNAYTVPPQKERKAVQEAREAGLRAYVPTEKKTYRHGQKTIKRRDPVAPGYVFAEGKPYEAKHIRSRVGAVERTAIARLYPRRDVGHMPPDPFKAGDQVVVQCGAFASLSGTVVAKCRRGWLVDVLLFGRLSRVSIATHNMRKHDPG